MTQDEQELFDRYIYWTKEEVECYNKGVADCIEAVRQRMASIKI